MLHNISINDYLSLNLKEILKNKKKKKKKKCKEIYNIFNNKEIVPKSQEKVEQNF